MIAKIFLIMLAAVVGGTIVALPGVSEAIRGGVGAIFGWQTSGDQAALGPANRTAAKNPESAPIETAAPQAGENEIHLTPEQIKLIGLKTTIVQRTPVVIDLMLNGEVTPNQDRTVQILPRVPGIVREVLKTLGDRVRANEPIAIIESRELAETEAAFLAAKSKAELAQRQLEREETLFKKKITAEQDYLTAKQAAEAAAIELRATEQKLTL
ncbi:MAG: efflux RND transporter periplasmic adaptor subunit, partial [Rhizobiales bacterium]|nr:efflux RND transporter periplasmic adaptor subunit [Hyphomicrobiales bacterium]